LPLWLSHDCARNCDMMHIRPGREPPIARIRYAWL
jgi:hypothetical protein